MIYVLDHAVLQLGITNYIFSVNIMLTIIILELIQCISHFSSNSPKHGCLVWILDPITDSGSRFS